MKKVFHFIALLLISKSIATAQFGGPPTGGGDGNGRTRSTNQQQPSLNLDGNVPKGNSKIIGFVIDSTAKKPVEFASIALINKATNKPIDGTMADEKGKFSITKIAAGEYKLLITFIGFADKTIDNIKLEKGATLDLGNVKLTTGSKMLDAVTVTGEKSLIEEKVDRLVYNASKDLTSRGGDASDVLKKVPMLSVDLDGNVSLRGTSNLKVLINNKPSTIVASSIADALKMIPADLIQTVEVITSPSAKYDAEGSGGIINIITKKSSIEGATLSIDAGVGLRASNLGLNGSYRHGKFGMTLGGFGRLMYNKAGTSLEQTTDLLHTSQTSNAKDNGLFGRYTLGLDYQLTKNQSLAGSIGYGTRRLDRTQNYITHLFSSTVNDSTSYRDVMSIDHSNSIDMSLDYVHTFKPQQEWSISTLYSQNNLTNNFDADILSSGRELLNRAKNTNNNVNKEFTVQTDYTTPIKQNQQLEFGVKGVFRQVDSDYQYLVSLTTGGYIPDAKNPDGNLSYNQNITSAYLSYSFATANKYNFKIGSRFEHTAITAKDQKGDINIPDYSNLVPSVNISKKFGETTLKFAYNNRIQRPGLQQLNPNTNISNPQSITQGNPDLKPEISNNFELGISKNIKKTYINVAVFTRFTNNVISLIRKDTTNGAIYATYQNVGKQQTTGVNLFGNTFITPKWTLNGGVDIYYNYMTGQVVNNDKTYSTISNSGVVISGRLMSQIQLNNGWGIQAFGGYRGNQVQLQGSQTGMGMYSIGFKKEFANKKASIGLAAENFFGGMTMRTTLNTAQFNQENINYIYNQNVKLTFSYKLGNMKFVEKKSKVKNDDVIGGDSN